ncbi:uncharacterized protein YjeT (DUF2065 family) [Kitasatospora sp. MAP12-15]|uniref:hypothetical protein n=1 Tax=unclassified Kitasatospora TaxID=2633591 RepID=UPI002474B009|nr:hypothetical protein [Kitasatospora sp. MAP12-44]MDH6113422.1 uncharacterized protein YjeT (DUF2065 family) [Kitasatospora sp. MAP12-44]
MGTLIRIGYTIVFAQILVGTVLNPNLFGLSDGAWLLLVLVEFVGGLVLLGVLQAALPRRWQQAVAGALPTSAMLRRRADGVLVKLGVIPARSAELDIAELGAGVTLFARAVRTDGERPRLGVLLLEAPAAGGGAIRWRQGPGAPELLAGPYTLSERGDTPVGAIARRLRATRTVRIGAFATVQVTPMDLAVLEHVAKRSFA